MRLAAYLCGVGVAFGVLGPVRVRAQDAVEWRLVAVIVEESPLGRTEYHCDPKSGGLIRAFQRETQSAGIVTDLVLRLGSLKQASRPRLPAT